MTSITPCFIPVFGIFYAFYNRNKTFRQGFDGSKNLPIIIIGTHLLYVFLTIFYFSPTEHLGNRILDAVFFTFIMGLFSFMVALLLAFFE